MPRYSRPHAEAGRKIVVLFGAADQPGEAALGKFRAGIVDGALDHLVVAAQHEHVGHRSAQHLSYRNRHQMRLALVARGFDQRVIVEPLRSGQHRSRDLDQVIERKRANSERRRRVDRSETIGEQRLGGGLDLIRQALENVVEQRDLFVRKIHRAVDEKIGHPAQGFDPARHGSVRQRGL